MQLIIEFALATTNGNRYKCELTRTVHRIGGNTQSTTNSHPLRDTYACVCVFAIAPTCHCAARHKYWRHRRRSVEVVLMARCIRQSFQLKFKLMQTSGQAPFHGESLRLNCSCTTRPSPSRGGRGGEGVTPRRSRPRINKLKFSPQLDNGNANAPESLISLFQ